MRRAPLLLVGLAGLLLAPAAAPDATVLTRAMTASTIVEAFVEKDRVRIELEIGVRDLEAFADLFPDGLRERMELPAEPLEERLERFFREGMTVRADDGEPIVGGVVRMEGRQRLVRDVITGDPLPNQPEDAEGVVFAELVYPLKERPRTLALRPPRNETGQATSDVGFVLVHGGVAVNDFRYLGAEETLELDWNDPWYTRFRNRNLRRQFFAPVSAFLYVEPFEVRKEVVVRPLDLQRWIDLGLEGQDVIRADQWGTLKQQVADFLMERCPVTIDGRSVEPVLDRIHFIERSMRTTSVITEPRDLPVLSATLGVIIAYPIKALPDEVTMEWELFAPEFQTVPSAATDEAGGMPSMRTPDDPLLVWKNFLTNPTVPGVVELAPPPAAGLVPVPLVSLALALVALALLWRTRRREARLPVQVGAGVLVLVAAVAWPHARVHARNPLGAGASLTEEASGEVVVGLLRNVYRAFDFRTESDIYDVLAKSASGDLLTQIYLETRRSLELENQGGARARVQDVELVETATTPLDSGPGFVSECRWNVSGSVGHWGHLHQRRNQYLASMRVEPVDGEWRITGLELVSEERL